MPARRVDGLLARYADAHRHRANRTLHHLGLPLAAWGALALLWCWSPAAAYVAIAALLACYLRLSPALAIGALALSAVAVYPLAMLGERTLTAGSVALALGAGALLAGHALEGSRPSFLADPRLLLLGPAWLLATVYRRLGISY